MLETILAILATHWAFLALALILGMSQEVIKSLVLGNATKENQQELTLWKKVFLRTLPLHPVIVGALFGLVLLATVPEMIGVSGVAGACLYFAASGALSTWLYSTVRGMAPTLSRVLKEKIISKIGKNDEPK